ncbi:hypothetical protein O5254_26970, partial [Escherichia coli]|nr:hypothetical protein [Escherichia coli]
TQHTRKPRGRRQKTTLDDWLRDHEIDELIIMCQSVNTGYMMNKSSDDLTHRRYQLWSQHRDRVIGIQELVAIVLAVTPGAVTANATYVLDYK